MDLGTIIRQQENDERLKEYLLIHINDAAFLAKAQKKVGDAVAIATTTFYPDPNNPILADRAELTELMIKKNVGLGYEIFVVDGGSHIDFIHGFQDAGATVMEEEEHPRGVLGVGRRQAMLAAYETGREVIVWTEPEKVPYVPEIVKTAVPIIKGFADLVVPQRKSLDSYPGLQQLAEAFGNGHWSEVTGLNLDVWFGPKSARGKSRDMIETVHYFLVYDSKSFDATLDYGDKWDSTFLPIIDAHMASARCLSVPVDYAHPESQTKFEQGNPDYNMKRLVQLENLVPAILHRWREYET